MDLNAAPRQVTLKGTVYRITPLRRRELAEFVAWCQDIEFAAAKRQTADMEPDDRAAFLDRAWSRLSTYTIGGQEVLRRMTTPEGAAKALWFGLRHEHPDLTEDQLFDLLSAEGTEEALAEALEAIDASLGGGRGAPARQKKTRRRQSR